MAGIVHRAKKAGTKEWVKGYYLKKSGSDYILPIADESYGALPELDNPQEGITYYIEYAVVSETVTLDSGEQDLEGKEIFEGDLVQEQSSKRDSNLPIGRIRYGKFPTMNASSGTSVGFYIEWLQEYCYYREDIGYWAPKEKIIGNIFDNPEIYKK